MLNLSGNGLSRDLVKEVSETFLFLSYFSLKSLSYNCVIELNHNVESGIVEMEIYTILAISQRI